jgi:hypothetical protein
MNLSPRSTVSRKVLKLERKELFAMAGNEMVVIINCLNDYQEEMTTFVLLTFEGTNSQLLSLLDQGRVHLKDFR